MTYDMTQTWGVALTTGMPLAHDMALKHAADTHATDVWHDTDMYGADTHGTDTHGTDV